MTFHNSTQNSMTFQALKAKKTKFHDFPGFPGPIQTLFLKILDPPLHSTKCLACNTHSWSFLYLVHYLAEVSLVRQKKKPLPGRVCFSVEHARAHAIKCQMKLIFSRPNFWTNDTIAKHHLVEVSLCFPLWRDERKKTLKGHSCFFCRALTRWHHQTQRKIWYFPIQNFGRMLTNG